MQKSWIDVNYFSSPLFSLDDHYEALKDKMNQRKKKLSDSLAIYKMYNETDLVKTWVTERVSRFPYLILYKIVMINPPVLS